MNAPRISLTLALAGFAFAPHAADLAAGQAKAAQVCAACHTADGNSKVAQFPILAGQHPDYIMKALHDYKSGERSNAIMGGQAKDLTEADIENLAAWFSSQPSVLNQNK